MLLTWNKTPNQLYRANEQLFGKVERFDRS